MNEVVYSQKSSAQKTGKRAELSQFFAFGEVQLFTITWHCYMIKITFLNWIKGPVFKILGDVLAEK